MKLADGIAHVVLVSVLVAAAVADVRSQRMFNWLTYPAMLFGLAFWAAAGYLRGGAGGALTGFGLSAAGLFIGLVPMAVFFAVGGCGGGDVKLVGAVGALAKPMLTMNALFYGVLAGALMAVVLMIRRRIVRRTLGRIGRFFWLALLSGPGRPAWPTDESSPRIPFGLAMLAGTGWALAERWLFEGRTLLDRLAGG